MLRVENVSVELDGVKILKDINFTVEKGDFVAVIGPNGSGKTTLLRTIAKYLKPKCGVIYLDGRNLSKLDLCEIAKTIGVVPQEFDLNLNFTVEEFVLTGRIPYLKGFGLESYDDRRIAFEAIDLVGCRNLVGRVVKTLSGGEKQRILIARALAQKPKVLLLDEPISHLDLNNQIEVLELLKDLTKRGLTVIATFHDLNLAIQYCNKVLILKNGEVVAYGTPEVLTPKIVREVFGVDVVVKKNPITGRMFVIPAKVEKIRTRVHVISGGGSGSKLLIMLEKASAGVLNVLDTDWEIAVGLGFEVVEEAPFSPISDESHEKNLRLIDKADFVVLTDVPFGFGNLKNLEASRYASELEKLIVIEKTPIEQRDFTNGKAKEIYKKLNAKFVRDESEAINVIQRQSHDNQ